MSCLSCRYFEICAKNADWTVCKSFISDVIEIDDADEEAWAAECRRGEELFFSAWEEDRGLED